MLPTALTFINLFGSSNFELIHFRQCSQRKHHNNLSPLIQGGVGATETYMNVEEVPVGFPDAFLR